MKTLKAQKADLENIKKAHEKNRGRKRSLESRKKQSETMRGRKPWNVGIKMTPEQTKNYGKGFRGKRGSLSPRWKGGKFQNSSGYVVIFKLEHPSANCHGYVPEHRLIMEDFLGRYLTKKEQVHHRNGIKNDNRLENLELKVERPHYGRIQCPRCQYKFIIR